MDKLWMPAVALAAVATLAPVAPAQAQDGMSWSWIEGGLSVLDLDGAGSEEGFDVRFSAGVTDNVYLLGSWDRHSIDTFFGDIDIDNYRFGAGFHADLSATAAWFVEASYQKLEVGGLSDDALRPDIGVRYQLGDRVEGRAFVGYAFGDDDDTALIGGDLLFKFTDGFGLSLGAESFEFDDTYYRANLRLSF